MTRIAFLGLGNMGGPMAANLVKARHTVTGFDPVAAALDRARDDGVTVTADAASAVAGAEIVITMFPSGKHVIDAYSGGLLAAATPGSLFIDCSTIDVDDARTARALAVAAGHRGMDAPVSGGVVGATAGTLTFMVGADDADFAAAEPILRRAQSAAEARVSAQVALFGAAVDGTPEPLRLAETTDWPELDRLAAEAEAVGFHLTAHPLDAYIPVLRRMGVVGSAQIEAQAKAGVGRAKLAGIMVATKERTTQKGSRMAWVRLSDAAGSFEVTLFSEVLSRSRALLVPGQALLVSAELKHEGEAVRITAMDVTALDTAAAKVAGGLRVWLDRFEAVGHIKAMLAREGSGRGEVRLVPRFGEPGGPEVEVRLPGGWNTSPRLAQAIKAHTGVQRVDVE